MSTKTLINMTLRNFQPADLPALVQLINEADRVDDAGFATTLPAFSHRLAEPAVEPTRNLFVAEEGGRLVGYVLLRARREETVHRIGAVGIVHPIRRRQGIGTALMRRAEEHARTFRLDRPVLLEMAVRQRVAGAAELALAMGLRPTRYFFYMQCHDLGSLPDPVFPPGITVRPMDPARDAEPFLAAYNDGFSDHWGYIPATRELLQHWFDSPGFCAEDALLGVTAEGAIAGLCLVEFPHMEPEMIKTNPPIIDDLAVTHAYRRRGLGRALLLAGMRRIRALGFQAAALGVDSANPNQAFRLYESVGFTIQSRTTIYQKELTSTDGSAG